MFADVLAAFEGHLTKTLKRTVQLSDGTTMPVIGLGTASNQSKDSLVNGVMKCGYAHLDTASIYKNEEVVGEAL